MVEDTVMSWLFGARSDAGARRLEVAQRVGVPPQLPHPLAGGPGGRRFFWLLTCGHKEI